MKNNLSSSVRLALNKAAGVAAENKTPYITPEMFLLGLLELDRFRSAVSGLVPDLPAAEKELSDFISSHAEKEDEEPGNIELSFQLLQVFAIADAQVSNAEADNVDVPHVVNAIRQLTDSFAANWLSQHISVSEGEFLSILNEAYASEDNAPGDARQKSWTL